ncbi:hypothetical protein [Treponema denticola]|uniref:hypothetical protein n=1 Tax=Treponema denticola TaxID=158 RepID=UPI0021066CC3|nr:hypothetical protein [Treponema denticola]UTY24936.1 hypothetical protein E4N78_13005 [Treponema denticola]
MLKRENGKTYRLYKKEQKSFAKVLDIKYRIGQNSQLHSFTASQLHSFTASQLHSFTAEGFLCPNKFTIKHKQIYSHKKPQGTQSAELRSTSQRNNQHVLGIGTIQSKTQDLPFEKPGFPKGCPLWQREEKGGGHRGRETTTALNGGLSLPLTWRFYG